MVEVTEWYQDCLVSKDRYEEVWKTAYGVDRSAEAPPSEWADADAVEAVLQATRPHGWARDWPPAWFAAQGAASNAAFALEEEVLEVGDVETTNRAETTRQADLLRCIIGNPFHPADIDSKWLSWNNGTIPAIARRIYDERRFEDMPILADALEDAGCADAAILDHCRGPGPHVRGCWVLDLLLGKE
jgi:hypothetical protein